MEKSKVIQFERNEKNNGKEQARQILKNGILDMSIERLIQMVNFGLCGNVEVMTGLCGTSNYFNHMNNSVGKNSKPLFEVNRTDERYLKAYNVLNSRKKAKQKLCQDIKKEIDRKNTDTKEITAKYDVFHYYCIKEIKDIFTDKRGIFNVNLAVNYIIDMEYNKGDFYTTSKDILWKCFGNVIC